ncbi:hypothetical protein DDB_G0287769 [Dictyostelium discoideum AX4]|uniref:Arginine-hydroxylase NDUFAF5, mitochondrial n=1 Tax=Dictyostelium discoideum TaxID=44689 RepID=NDUF5_DICDI|nr:hypothetical protein DDB_G0287769 [Dictyostelium discoideum AX4]Q54JW0.1 RecName: Full=Arginine-hydroxylase NDUFAF5, mitochondrial; AltName: Full=NADH dehydrogenase [ubiquinone] 1 alpha subcomplex assembly factor 5; AltName: Full=Putative methyltransferase NDUFAF5; Flags: Precursor [Dictyostelium discoideum]EAL63531.1 hypothetical protein DDB_G0287769 [Dictyostelium discoideum AX4]|eukprot:XP_637042.1 hypothetical protein DDB_G0287769 [Dictyostelium discoideum AX4]
MLRTTFRKGFNLKCFSKDWNQTRQYSNYTKMTIFDTNVKTIQKNNTVTNVDDPKHYDYLMNEVADRLADRILDIKDIKCGNVLDFGSRNGALFKYIQEKGAKIDKYYMVESSKELLYRDDNNVSQENEDDNNNNKVKPTKILVNSLEDKIEGIEDQSLDLIISNLSLHWVNDLPGVFGGLKRLLKPNGVFLASLFGEDTLMELKDSLYLAEIEREGGFSPHVSPFTKISDIGNILSKNRYTLPTVDTEKITINYDNMFVLMRDLQNMGENNAILKRRNYTSKDTFLAASAIYKHLYGNEDNNSIPATFQIIYLIGWAPHESQQKPLQRGSAKKHFSEISGTSSFGYKFDNDSSIPSILTNENNSVTLSQQQQQQGIEPQQSNDDSINEPFPKTDDFVIKRLDYHGNFHFEKQQQQQQQQDQNKESSDEINKNKDDK